MTKITSRQSTEDEITQRIRKQEMMKLAEAVADELDQLEDKISDFLEMRITAEFDELRDDILQTKAVNDVLMNENIAMSMEIEQLRNEITKLTIDNMKLSAQ